jgi:Protein of unknown function (DUF4446)
VSTSSLAVVATGLSVFALLVAVALAVQVGRLRRTWEARALRADTGELRPRASTQGPRDARALTRVAVVRYDAFGDLAGALSFSAALLDDAGNGLVLSSINGRSETRTYAKGVTAGASDAPLSPEEQEAIAEAFARPVVAGRATA